MRGCRTTSACCRHVRARKNFTRASMPPANNTAISSGIITAMNPLLAKSRLAGFAPAGSGQGHARGGKLFVGRHDFKSFAGTRNYEMESTVRGSRVATSKNPAATDVHHRGRRFSYKMCRGIVGTLVQVGQGKIPLAKWRILASRDRRVAGMTAPAHGLVLWKVFYKSRVQSPKSKVKSGHEHRPA
jgi:hypothetical protein